VPKCQRRTSEECKEKHFDALPDRDFCWACASDEEREEWLEQIAVELCYDRLSIRGNTWQEVFEEARAKMINMGYCPEDDPINVSDKRFLFLVNWANQGYLQGMDLSNKILAVANLQNTNLFKSNLTNTSLWGANLEGAELSEADLTGTRIWLSRLEGVKIWWVDFQKAEYHLRYYLFKRGVGDDIKQIGNEPERPREWVYRELASYWRRLGYHEDEDWARVKHHRVRLMKELGFSSLKDAGFKEGDYPGAEEGWQWFLFWLKKGFPRMISFRINPIKWSVIAGWLLLDILSKYGTSVWRAIIWSFAIWIAFGIVYSIWPGLANISNLPVIQRAIAGFYYSIVTFATLGFGDIHPSGSLGQILATIEVILGYVMLGVLVSVIARKMSR